MAGGTRSEISLKEPITQILSQLHNLAHPRSRALLVICNGVFGVVKHEDDDTFKLKNSYGMSVGKKSALKFIDRYVEGPNKVPK